MPEILGVDPSKVVIQGITSAVAAAKPYAEKAIGALNSVTTPESKKQGKDRASASEKYKYDILQFPSDLGEGLRHPYYMTFYINQQDLSRFKKKSLTARDTKGREIQSTVQRNQAGIRTIGKNIGDSGIGFGRKTSRTKMAIRLFMPDTLSWQYQNAFKDVSLSGLPFAAAAQGLTAGVKLGQSMVEGYEKGGIPGVLASLAKGHRNATGPLAEYAGKALLGEGGDAVALSALGISINPQVDVIYESPALREFSFDFLFAPRNAGEAAAVAQIVKQFKFHGAPELYGQNSGIGRYFVPPSEFDIEFSVPTMGKISTCVLQNITLDYGSSGAAFYADDNPVYTRMTLQFKELEFMTKNLIEEKGY